MRLARNLLIGVLAIGFVLFLARKPLVEFVFERVALSALSDRSLLEDDTLHVHLCGTGIPAMDATAGSACSAVVAAGEVLMIDAGAGGLQRLTVDRVPVEELSTILVTHLHSDHIGGLGDAINLSVFRGRERPLVIYGPPGIERVVHGFVTAYAADAQLRSHPDGGFIDPNWTRPDVHTIDITGDEAVIVLERGALRVAAFAMDHYPVDHSLGFRIDYRGRAVAFSGDTRGDPRLAMHATDVDLLVHSASAPVGLAERLAPILERQGRTRDARLTLEGQRIIATPVEAAKLAQAANAQTLVFSHKPPIPKWIETLYLWGVSDVYEGDVIVGRDGMRFDFPARPSTEASR